MAKSDQVVRDSYLSVLAELQGLSEAAECLARLSGDGDVNSPQPAPRSTTESAMPIKPGLVYRSCDPRDNLPIRIRVCPDYLGENRVAVVDAATGKRPRSILASSLHASPFTAAGQPRRTGYALETEPVKEP